MKYTNIYKLPDDMKHYSKKELLDMYPTLQNQKYYCIFDQKYYNSMVSDEHLFKKYPRQNFYYKVR